jgi:hypothetical protein
MTGLRELWQASTALSPRVIDLSGALSPALSGEMDHGNPVGTICFYRKFVHRHQASLLGERTSFCHEQSVSHTILKDGDSIYFITHVFREEFL